jgi:hypothetical protein
LRLDLKHLRINVCNIATKEDLLLGKSNTLVGISEKYKCFNASFADILRFGSTLRHSDANASPYDIEDSFGNDCVNGWALYETNFSKIQRKSIRN